MIHKQRTPIRISITLAAMLLASALLGSCSSGGSSGGSDTSAGIGGTGIVYGRITAFGSIWVNGRRFDVDNSEIIVDGEMLTEDDLAIGMVVRLDVDTKNGMFGSAATQVIFDDAIQGPVNGSPTEVGGAGSGVKLLDIFGFEVKIDATRTLYSGTSYDDIGDGDVLEISGFPASETQIVATYVRKTGELTDPPPIEVELRGTIENNVPGTSFEINGVTINYVGAIRIDVDGGQPEDGMFVEVEGTFMSHTLVNAREIEQEDETFGDNVDDISLHGIVSGYDATGAGLGEFFVNGQRVDASSAELEPENLDSLMQNGLEVEVEGEIVNGVLIAEELELREGDSEVRATVVSKDPGGSFVVAFPVGTVTITTSGLTVFEDESAVPIANFSFDTLAVGHFVEVEGIEVEGIGTADTLSAQVVKRREPNDTKLQGAVDAIDPLVSITILGITYPMDPAAVYEEGAMTAAQFFHPSNLKLGDIVELEDDEPDGFADEVGIDD